MTVPIAVSLMIPDEISRSYGSIVADHRVCVYSRSCSRDTTEMLLIIAESRIARGAPFATTIVPAVANERGTACVANDSPRETAGPPMTTHRLWHSAWMGKDGWMGGWIDGSMDRRREACAGAIFLRLITSSISGSD